MLFTSRGVIHIGKIYLQLNVIKGHVKCLYSERSFPNIWILLSKRVSSMLVCLFFCCANPPCTLSPAHAQSPTVTYRCGNNWTRNSRLLCQLVSNLAFKTFNP